MHIWPTIHLPQTPLLLLYTPLNLVPQNLHLALVLPPRRFRAPHSNKACEHAHLDLDALEIVQLAVLRQRGVLAQKWLGPVHGLWVLVCQAAGDGLRVVVCEGVELVFCEEEEVEHCLREVWSGDAGFDVDDGRDREAHLGQLLLQLRIAARAERLVR